MPIYRYRCICGFELKRFFSPQKAEKFVSICTDCGKNMTRQMGTPATLAKETKDEYRGKSIDQDTDRKVSERAHQHFVEHDLPRIIQEHGMEFAKRQGFVDEDGRPSTPKLKK